METEVLRISVRYDNDKPAHPLPTYALLENFLMRVAEKVGGARVGQPRDRFFQDASYAGLKAVIVELPPSGAEAVLAHRLSEAQETIRALMEANRDINMKLNDVQTRVLGEMNDANEKIKVLRQKLTDFGIMS